MKCGSPLQVSRDACDDSVPGTNGHLSIGVDKEATGSEDYSSECILLTHQTECRKLLPGVHVQNLPCTGCKKKLSRNKGRNSLVHINVKSPFIEGCRLHSVKCLFAQF